MPRYEFDNEETDEIETHYVKIDDLEEFKKNNPHLKKRICSPGYADSVRIGVKKNPDSWHDLVKNVKKRYHGSTIETK